MTSPLSERDAVSLAACALISTAPTACDLEVTGAVASATVHVTSVLERERSSAAALVAVLGEHSRAVATAALKVLTLAGVMIHDPGPLHLSDTESVGAGGAMSLAGRVSHGVVRGKPLLLRAALDAQENIHNSLVVQRQCSVVAQDVAVL